MEGKSLKKSKLTNIIKHNTKKWRKKIESWNIQKKNGELITKMF
jgi:hypothetical protein